MGGPSVDTFTSRPIAAFHPSCLCALCISCILRSIRFSVKILTSQNTHAHIRTLWMIVISSIPCLGSLVDMTDKTSFMFLYSDLCFTRFVFTSTFGLLKHFDSLSWLPCWHDWYVPLWDITTPIELCVFTSALCLFWCVLASLSCRVLCFLWAVERENISRMHQTLVKSSKNA